MTGPGDDDRQDNRAANSSTVAIVTARSIRLPSALFGRGAVPRAVVNAYKKAPIAATPETAISKLATPPPMTALPRTNQNAANAA